MTSATAGPRQWRARRSDSDLTDLDHATLQRLYVDAVMPIEFGPTLDDQIGGQLDAGFLLTGMYEDYFDEAAGDPLSRYVDSFVATRAIKGRSENGQGGGTPPLRND